MFEIITTHATNHEGVKYTRPALVYKPKSKVLDHPYVWACKFAEFNTSEEYLKILRRFVVYLMTRPCNPFDEKGILDFWRFVTAGDIQVWQQSRMEEAMANGKGDKWDTIAREAKIVTQFLYSVSNAGESMIFHPRTKTILSRAEAENSVHEGRGKKVAVDYEDIQIPRPIISVEDVDHDDLYPDDDQSLPNNFGYLPSFQIVLAMELFADPVYEAISLAGYHTGLRNFEALAIPVMTAGRTFVSSPTMLKNKLREGHTEMILKVKGKGSKPRKVPFDIATWLGIMEIWWPEFQDRKRRYKETTGKDLPAKVLWINKQLKPLYCDPDDKTSHKSSLSCLQKAYYYISKTKNGCTEITSGFRINFYKFRHTFATLFIYDAMKKSNDWDGARWLMDMSIRDELRERMGHKLLSTTFKHYVDSAIFLHLHETGNAKRWFPDPMAHLERVNRSRALRNGTGRLDRRS